MAGDSGWSVERLRTELEGLDRDYGAAQDALPRAQLGRQRGRLARTLAARTGDLGDLSQARERLTAALSEESNEGADPALAWTLDAERCEAGFELVRLESIEARDVGAAAPA